MIIDPLNDLVSALTDLKRSRPNDSDLAECLDEYQADILSLFGYKLCVNCHAVTHAMQLKERYCKICDDNYMKTRESDELDYERRHE